MWYNGIMKAVLRSPLHSLLSKNMLIVMVTGRKSGKHYETPVSYLRSGDVLWIVSWRDRTWWRNLRGGASLRVRLQGHELQARGDVAEDEPAITAALLSYLQQAPRLAHHLGVGLDGEGRPLPDDVARAAQSKVMIRLELAGSQPAPAAEVSRHA